MTKRAGRGRPAHPDILTPAEWTSVDAARHGMTTAEIARRRGVSRDAVKQHLENARDKLGLNDRAAVRAWHRDVPGLPHLYTFGKLAFFDCGGVRLFLEEGEGTDAAVIYFRVPDIRAAHAQLQARGVQFDGAPHLIHRHADGMEEWMAFFHDNEGRVLALMSQVRPG